MIGWVAHLVSEAVKWGSDFPHSCHLRDLRIRPRGVAKTPIHRSLPFRIPDSTSSFILPPSSFPIPPSAPPIAHLPRPTERPRRSHQMVRFKRPGPSGEKKDFQTNPKFATGASENEVPAQKRTQPNPPSLRCLVALPFVRTTGPTTQYWCIKMHPTAYCSQSP